MSSRRNFLKKGVIGGTAIGLGISARTNAETADPVDRAQNSDERYKDGLVISTWDHGLEANKGAWKSMLEGGNALDMAEKGVMVSEADLTNLSVGLGGLPDRDGFTTLDACIMDFNGRAGSVMFLQNIKHPISVARRVMEKTPHIQLAGKGAYKFAIAEGFPHDDFKNAEAQKRWIEWLKTSDYKPVINIENHDTIGLLAMDKNGNLSGSCTTSGLAYKIHGRVGDSPIIGAGLYVDNEVGAATATGLGEEVIRICGSFLVVELMRNGRTPQQACEEAVNRLVKKSTNTGTFQVGFLAVNTRGETGAYSVQPGFNYALYKNNENRLVNSASYPAKN